MSDTATPHMPGAEPARGRAIERGRWRTATVIAALTMLAILVLLLLAVPREGGTMLWTEQMVPGGWMAWSFPVALFFWFIAALLVTFTLLALRYPETPRVGILGLETTRGDRLFISLLGSAFLNLAWLGLVDASQWWGLVIALAFSAAVFWKV